MRQGIIYFFFVAFIFTFYVYLSNLNPLLSYAGGVLGVNDFAYHFLMFKYFWLEKADIYLPQIQLKVLSNYFSKDVIYSMPIGMSPSVAVIWLPLVFIDNNFLTLAYSVWMTISLIIFGYGIYRIFPMINVERFLLIITLIIISSSSSLARANLTGQTTLFATGLLMILYNLLSRNKTRILSFKVIAILAALTIKPFYLLIALPLVVVFGFFLEAIISVLLVLGLYMFLFYYSDVNLFISYVFGLKAYNQVSAFSQYAGAVNLESINTLRSVLLPILGEGKSFFVCEFLQIAFFLLIIYLSYQLKAKDKQLAKQVCLTASISNILVFSPFLGLYEEMLVIPAFCLCLFGANPKKLNPSYFISATCLLFVILNFSYFIGLKCVYIFFTAKLLLFVMLLRGLRFENIKL